MPADNKWYARLIIGAALVDALEELQLEYPKLSRSERREFAAARRALDRER